MRIAVKKKTPPTYTDLFHKNKNLVDSINYAYQIQDGILPKSRHIQRIWPSTFVLYMPKDTVSGDFYWITEKDNYIFWIVADCSGHGVPGAMLTMLGHSFLNYIILGKGLTSPVHILNEMDKKMLETFRFSDNSEHIDISLVRYNKNTNELHFSGARRKLVHVRKDEITSLEGDRYPIGGMHIEMHRSFTSKKIKIEPGDMVYIGSDGYQDQFGGPKGKKLSSKRLHDLLLTISEHQVELQKIQLRMFLHDWKKQTPQIDDICIMGIRF